jgi:predicted nucleic acid-binding protein
MPGYLLDTNIISVLAAPRHPRYTEIQARMRRIASSSVFLPVIAIAEIEFGMRKAVNPDPKQQEEVRKFFAAYPHHLSIDDHTIEPYSMLRAKLWRLLARSKRTGRGHVEKVPEELMDRVTGKELGIDERDLLIASVAAQHRLVLATNDQNAQMRRIEEAGKALELEGSPFTLLIEYW